MKIENLIDVDINMELANIIRDRFYNVIQHNFNNLFSKPISTERDLLLFCLYIDSSLINNVGENNIREVIDKYNTEKILETFK
jgi:hypothetical protein